MTQPAFAQHQYAGLMTHTKTVAMLAVLAVAVVGMAHAAEQLGVRVYAGAKPETAAAKAIPGMMPGTKAYCFMSGDSVDKVAAFFKQQGLKYMTGDAQNAMFKKGTVDVRIQRPWMDMPTGRLRQTTLISIAEPAR